jgi:hypothetical protein
MTFVKFLRLPLWVVLPLVVALGCQNPSMSGAECQEMCRADGKKVKQYRVGGVVPIFHPRPAVVCECE